jgi:hypothetical protein
MKKNKTKSKITPEDIENISIILDNLSVNIQKFTEKSLYTKHIYNGKKFSHNPKQNIIN